MIGSISEEQYEKTLTIENKRGKVENITWCFMMHLFNHQTHHMGGLAVILDQMGVKNDFSNLLWKESFSLLEYSFTIYYI
ncbi:MAG: hypothetical protein JW891_07995 [Candidatus Lokiarchaeota archaeon]|nr:hypothetical protein [Candidatus Lokiarchaeota archaeon]